MASLLYKNERQFNKYDEKSIIFKDLNLDDIFEEINRYSRSFNITKYFYQVPKSVEDIMYRHEVFKDLENPGVYDAVNKFSYTLKKKIEEIEENEKTKYATLKQIRLKQSITGYINILNLFLEEMSQLEFKSQGLNMLVNYIKEYLSGKAITFIINDMKLIDEEMSHIKYRLSFDGGSIKMDKYEDKEVIKDNLFKYIESYECENNLVFTKNYGKEPEHVLGQIYGRLKKYYPDEFQHLELYSRHFKDFIDKDIKEMVSEIQFYVSYINLMKQIKTMNLSFNYPQFDIDSVYCNKGYDLALAIKYLIKHENVVPNDFIYNGKERVIVVSGPNQGGKTTFSRYVGQSFYLSNLGYPTTGTSSAFTLVSSVKTMYEVEENAGNLNGKLKSELIRIKDVMDNLGDNGLLIMNEVFSSTSLYDGIILGKKVIDMLNQKNAYAVFVTFIEELAKYNDTCVNMGSTVDSNDPSIRTFEILRRNDNSHAYAISIAKKNEVSYEDIIRRID